MQRNKVQILSTKLLGKELLAIAKAHEIFVDEISFIKTEAAVDDKMKNKIEQLAEEKITVAFTSLNSAEAISNFISSKPTWEIFCIGHATKKTVATIFGKENIKGTADNAKQLAQSIKRESSSKKVIFFCGDQRRDELPSSLRANGIEVEELIVYKTFQTPELISKSYDGILFFSPSAVKSFFLLNNDNDYTTIFAIGNTTAKALASVTKQPVIISKSPGKESLVKLMIHHYNTVKNFDAGIKK